MSSLGSREKGRASQKAGGDGEGGREGQREQGGNRRPTDRPTKKQTAAVVDDHIAAYIHYPNTFSIVVGITPLARISLHP